MIWVIWLPRLRSRPKFSSDQTFQTKIISDQTVQTEINPDQTFQTKDTSDQTLQTQRVSDQTFQTEGVLIRPSSDHGQTEALSKPVLIRLKCARNSLTRERL